MGIRGAKERADVGSRAEGAREEGVGAAAAGGVRANSGPGDGAEFVDPQELANPRKRVPSGIGRATRGVLDAGLAIFRRPARARPIIPGPMVRELHEHSRDLQGGGRSRQG